MSGEPVDPNNPRDAVVAAGRERLLRSALDTLRSQLNASVLSAVAPVSRDTAYRVFRGDTEHPNVTDSIVAAVSEAANDPAWTGYFDAVRRAVATYQSADADRVTQSLQINFETQFCSPGLPVTWLLQSAALTASDAWNGEKPADDEDLALGRAILAHRRGFYEEVTQHWVGLLAMVMSEAGRRPRSDVDLATIVMLLHALQDGAVLRCLIEPEALPSPLVAEAMYRLAEAFSEEGALTDPRRPDDERGGRIFDRLVEAAADLWQLRPEVTLEDAAAHAEVPLDAACLLFPTVGDLADSLIRARVVGAGFADLGLLPDDAEVSQHLLGLVSELQSLRDFADDLPAAVAATRQELPKRSAPFVDDFVDNESRVVAALGITPDPVRLVRDLYGFASQGTSGWVAVTALLRTLGHDDDQ